MFDSLTPQQFEACLQRRLPGQRAWRRFEPDLSYGRHAGPAPENARRAAVLLLLFPIDDSWHIALTVRPEYDGLHAGQVSFPGGALEYGESTADAALRELQEEINPSVSPRMIGRLSPLYVSVSNYRVTPWVALADEQPQWTPCPREVAAVVEAPLAEIGDRKNWTEIEIDRAGLKFKAPCIQVAGVRVWGATSMMLSEFLMALEEATR